MRSPPDGDDVVAIGGLESHRLGAGGEVDDRLSQLIDDPVHLLSVDGTTAGGADVVSDTVIGPQGVDLLHPRRV